MAPRIQSPQKRVTRSRAKALDETKPNPTTRKGTTTAKATAAAPPSTKRMTRTDDLEDELGEVQPALETKPEEPAMDKPGTAGRKAPASSTAKRTTVAAASRAKVTRANAKSTRGRGKSTMSENQDAQKEESLEAEPPARSTRARTASVSENTTEAVETSAPVKKTTARKKVTFEDAESDKENVVEADGSKDKKAPSKKPTSTAVGIKARPIRRPATRGTASARASQSRAAIAPKPTPLSPKKNVQVGTQQQDDRQLDEEAPAERAATPEKQLQKSPVKAAPGSTMRSELRSPTKTSQFDGSSSIDELQNSVALFTSPAKRPLASIYESPSKSHASAMQSLLHRSPDKVEHVSRILSYDGLKQTPKPALSQPPQKFPMSAPPKQSGHDKPAETHSQSAMFASPAKRPASPIKDLRFGSSVKPSASERFDASSTASGVRGTPRKLFSPVKASSAFRAARSPAAALKVHKMTEEEQTQMFQDELDNAPSPLSSPSRHLSRPVAPKQLSKIPVRSPPRSSGSAQETPTLSGSRHHSVSDVKQNETMSPVPAAAIEAAGKAALSTPFRLHRECVDPESDDELYAEPSIVQQRPSRHGKCTSNDSATLPATPAPVTDSNVEQGPMTELAQRFGAWKGATPTDENTNERLADGVVFSLAFDASNNSTPAASPAAAHPDLLQEEFDQTIAIHEDEDSVMSDRDAAPTENSFFRQSQRSDASQEYGDENAVPFDPALTAQTGSGGQGSLAFCTPAKINNDRPRTLHTVSKVPLKPAADDHTPQQRPARRGHSLAATLSPHAELELGLLRQCHPSAANQPAGVTDHTAAAPARSSRFAEMLDEDELTIVTPTTRENRPSPPSSYSVAANPARTPRPDLDSRLLSGATVFVDVHTTEGADASSIFVELLTQMGARCVKHWSWNPNGSPQGAEDGESASQKIGITHVVFKDGGKRTMEKVREAKGVVSCVGVGWVLE